MIRPRVSCCSSLLLTAAAIGNTLLIVAQRIQSGNLQLRIARLDLAVATLLAGFTLAGNQASAMAILDMSPALLNVLLRADVLFVAIFAWVLLGERVERRFWLGGCIAVVGLVVLQGPLGVSGASGIFDPGTAMAIGAAACFSGLAIVTRRFVHQIDLVSVNAIRLWLSVALWFPFNGVPDVGEIPREQIVYAVLAAIAGPFLGRLALMISARYVEARVTALATLSAPVLTLILAYFWLSDWPETHELVGGGIMIAGISIPLLRRSVPASRGSAS